MLCLALKSRQMRQASRVLLSIYFEIFRFYFLYLESLKVFRKIKDCQEPSITAKLSLEVL
jgi:hypothetical protein